jgi:hypothetical protein
MIFHKRTKSKSKCGCQLRHFRSLGWRSAAGPHGRHSGIQASLQTSYEVAQEPIRPSTVPGESPSWSRCGGSWPQQAIITILGSPSHHITPFSTFPAIISPTAHSLSHTHTQSKLFWSNVLSQQRSLPSPPFPKVVVLEVKVGVFLQVQRTVRDGDGAFVDAVDALTSASVAGFVVLSGGSGWDSEWD